MKAGRRPGFTLIEVILASMIASGGLLALYGGVNTCVQAEERRYFYESCAAFLETNLQYLIDSTGSVGPGTTFSGQILLEGPPVKYAIAVDPFTDPTSDGVVGLLKVTVTFTGTIGARPVTETVVTYIHPDLQAERKTIQKAPPKAGP